VMGMSGLTCLKPALRERYETVLYKMVTSWSMPSCHNAR
jgi:hypothetical protein